VLVLNDTTLEISRGFFDSATYTIDGQVSAAVETAGSLSTRPTFTRTGAGLLIAGPIGGLLGFASRKKVDKRELYLVVEGADWAELVELKPKQGEKARRFAQQINLAARRS
jgi:hypothetical protein